MQLQAIMERYTQNPQSGAPATGEMASCVQPRHLETAYTLAIQRVFVASDHMVALERAIIEDSLSYSPWTCSRGVLESCSVASWLFEEQIEPLERVTRSFNLRLQNLRSQLAFFRTLHPVDQQAIIESEGRIRYLRCEASKMGIAEKLDKNGRFLGFGLGIPSHTELINNFYAKRTTEFLPYALLSAAAHGEDWAVSALGSRTLNDQTGASRKPELRPEYGMLLIIQSIEWLAYPCWEWWKLYGWDMAELEGMLDNAYNGIGMIQGLRFWR